MYFLPFCNYTMWYELSGVWNNRQLRVRVNNKETSKLRNTAPLLGKPPVIVDFPSHRDSVYILLRHHKSNGANKRLQVNHQTGPNGIVAWLLQIDCGNGGSFID